jgi:hypothetical protein
MHITGDPLRAISYTHVADVHLLVVSITNDHLKRRGGRHCLVTVYEKIHALGDFRFKIDSRGDSGTVDYGIAGPLCIHVLDFEVSLFARVALDVGAGELLT